MKLLALFLFIFSISSCNNAPQEKEIPKEKNKMALVENIDFYAVDSMFIPYFPDTIPQFNSLREMSDYYLKKHKVFMDFSKDQISINNNSDSIILMAHSAEIEFNRLSEILYFRQVQKSPKDNASMSLLSFLSLRDGVNMGERIDYFNSFTEKIKSNEIGQKTWDRIQLHRFEKNIGNDMNQFKNLKLTNPFDTSSSFLDLLKEDYKYFILVFGASWCKPCRLDEKQLKYWMPLIDTSKVKIIGLSIDNKKENWLKYLKEEVFPWDSYLLADEWNNTLLKALDFNSVPMNFLVKNNGKIVSQNNDLRSLLIDLRNLE